MAGGAEGGSGGLRFKGVLLTEGGERFKRQCGAKLKGRKSVPTCREKRDNTFKLKTVDLLHLVPPFSPCHHTIHC